MVAVQTMVTFRYVGQQWVSLGACKMGAPYVCPLYRFLSQRLHFQQENAQNEKKKTWQSSGAVLGVGRQVSSICAWKRDSVPSFYPL